MKLIFLDTETTSLRHDRRAWEIALIARDERGEVERSWFIDSADLDLGNADLMSLKIGKFHERHPGYKGLGGGGGTVMEHSALREVERITRGATIVGAVPNFDTEVLAARMREHGICPAWHYHLIDVETLAAGALRLPPPWSFDDILARYGLTYDEAKRHTALGDARMVRDLYDAVLAAEQLAEPSATTERPAPTAWCGNPDQDDPCDNCDATLTDASAALRQRMPDSNGEASTEQLADTDPAQARIDEREASFGRGLYRPVVDEPAQENRCAHCSEAIALVGDTWYHDVPHEGHPSDSHKATPANLTPGQGIAVDGFQAAAPAPGGYKPY